MYKGKDYDSELNQAGVKLDRTKLDDRKVAIDTKRAAPSHNSNQANAKRSSPAKAHHLGSLSMLPTIRFSREWLPSRQRKETPDRGAVGGKQPSERKPDKHLVSGHIVRFCPDDVGLAPSAEQGRALPKHLLSDLLWRANDKIHEETNIW